MIMTENEILVLRQGNNGSLYTDFLSVTSFYTAPISFLGFPILSYSISCCVAQSHERKAIHKRHTFAWAPWRPGTLTAGCWHPPARWRPRRWGARPAEQCGRLPLCSCSCTPSTGEAHGLPPATACRGLGQRHWKDNSDTEYALNEMVPKRSISPWLRDWFCQLEPQPGAQVDRKNSKIM